MRLLAKSVLCVVCAFGMVMLSSTPGDAQDKGKEPPEKKEGKDGKDGKEGKGGFGKGIFGQGKGGFPGSGNFGRGGQPGQIMSTFLRDMLKMSDEQKKQMDELQKEVDGKIEKILTDEQKKQLKEMRERGPGFGGGFPGGAGKGGFPPKKDN